MSRSPSPLPSPVFSCPPACRALPGRRYGRGAFALVAVALAVPSAAHGQTASAGKIALAPVYASQKVPSLPRVDAEGKEVRKRALNLTPDGISFQDCIDNVRIRYPITMSQPNGSDHVEVWAALSSNDCSAQTARQEGANKVCWRLNGGANLALQINQNVDIPVRDILAGAKSATDLYDATTTEACGAVDLSTVTVQFLYFAAGDTSTPADKLAVAMQADTVGPVAPSGLEVLPGNQKIHVSWDGYGEGGVTTLTGVNVYCDLPSASATPTSTCDAATASDEDATIEDASSEEDATIEDASSEEDLDAGSGSSADACTPSSAATCQSPNFVLADGTSAIPDSKFNDTYKCGTGATGNTITSVVADTFQGAPLVNGTTYVVAVAATDAFGNVGRLSSPVCEYPEPTNDFWENYKRAGGGAGGGYCSVEGVGLPMGSLSVLLLTSTTALSMVARRRRRSSSSKPSR